MRDHSPLFTLLRTSAAPDAARDFAQALISLSERSKLSRISVSSIAKRAGYSRKTFYEHFSTKNDLINWIMDLSIAAEVPLSRPDRTANPGWDAVHASLHAFEKDRKLFSEMLGVTGNGSPAAHFKQMLSATFGRAYGAELLELLKRREAVETCLDGLADSIYAIALRWLSNPDRPSADEALLFIRTSLSVYGAVIAPERGSCKSDEGDSSASM